MAIKDLGVMGAFIGREEASFWAGILGDRPADPGLGVGGGGIKSESGSGDIEPFSEDCWLVGNPRLSACRCISPEELDLFTVAMTSATSFAGIVVLPDCFFLCAFMAGDSRTDLMFGLPPVCGVRLFCLLLDGADVAAFFRDGSKVTSIGEVVSE